MKTLNLLSLLVSVSLLSACGIDQATVAGDVGGDELSASESELATKGKFETFEGKDGKTYFQLIAGNGEKVLRSQGYASSSGALDGIASVKVNGISEARYLLREASNGQWYFVLTAANGAIIGNSEMYVSQSNATRGIGSVIGVVKNTIEQGQAAPGAARFEVFKGLDAKYYFHARAVNGEIVLQSQAYTSRASANAGVTSVQTNGAIAARYTVLPAADGSFYFVLKAANAKVIAMGETYASKSSAQRGVDGCVTLLGGTMMR